MNILTQIAALYAAWIYYIIRIFIRVTLRNLYCNKLEVKKIKNLVIIIK
jgi:hypothetical protein